MITKNNRISFLLIISILLMSTLACISTTNNNDNKNANNVSDLPDLEATTVAIQKTQEALESIPDDILDVPEDNSSLEYTYYTQFADLENWFYYSQNEDIAIYGFDYFNPGLNLYVPNANDWLALYFGEYWSRDVRLEVEFEFIGGPDDTYLEIYCRSNNDVETYFSIASDGYWIIGFADYTFSPAEFTTLASGQTNLVEGLNFAVAYCEGEELALYINEEFQGETTHSNVHEGDVGIGVLTFDGGPGEWFVNYFYIEDIE